MTPETIQNELQTAHVRSRKIGCGVAYDRPWWERDYSAPESGCTVRCLDLWRFCNRILWPTNENRESPSLQREIRYKVSSKHLTLASPAFAKALSGSWREGSTLREKGTVTINVEDWNSEAFLTILNIFHGRFSDIPNQVGVELLAKLTVLADYYQCLANVEVFAHMWMKDGESFLPRVYGRELLLELLALTCPSTARSLRESLSTRAQVLSQRFISPFRIQS